MEIPWLFYAKSKCIEHAKIKHIELVHHFIQKKVEKRIIEIMYVPFRDQETYLFTKPLGNRDLKN